MYPDKSSQMTADSTGTADSKSRVNSRGAGKLIFRKLHLKQKYTQRGGLGVPSNGYHI